MRGVKETRSRVINRAKVVKVKSIKQEEESKIREKVKYRYYSSKG